MPKPPVLPIRQLQILVMVGEGLTKPEIAERLWVSYDTVKTHRARVARALKIPPGSKDAALVAAGFKTGILRPVSEDPVEIPEMTATAIAVLRDVAEGFQNHQIAAKYNRTIDSIKYQVAALLHLWGAKNRAHMTYMAYMARVLPWNPDVAVMIPPVPRAHKYPLVGPEIEVITHIASGMRRDDIARHMGMSHGRLMRITSDIHSKFRTMSAPHMVALGYCYGYLKTRHIGEPDPALDPVTVNVVECVARGYNRTQAAVYTKISEADVKDRLAKASAVLRANNQASLINRAFQTGNLVIKKAA